MPVRQKSATGLSQWSAATELQLARSPKHRAPSGSPSGQVVHFLGPFAICERHNLQVAAHAAYNHLYMPLAVFDRSDMVRGYDDLDHRFEALTAPSLVEVKGNWIGSLPAPVEGRACK
jgi:hypothetical protein